MGDEKLLLSAVCLVQEVVGTSGACCRCARDCVFMARDMLRMVVKENFMFSSRPTW